jgi:hypothetical protein
MDHNNLDIQIDLEPKQQQHLIKIYVYITLFVKPMWQRIQSERVNTYYYINCQSYTCTFNTKNTNRSVIGCFFFQGDLIFLFITSISLHNLRIVAGFFLLSNDDSFNKFGLLKKYFWFFFFFFSCKYWTLIFFTNLERWYLLSSPYNTKVSVEVLKISNSLQKF